MPDYLSHLIQRSRRPAEELLPRPRVLFEPWVAGSPPGELAGEAQAGREPGAGADALPSRATAVGESDLAVRPGRIDTAPRPGSAGYGSPADDPEAAISGPPVGKFTEPFNEVRPVLEPDLPERPGTLLPRPLPEFLPPVETSGQERGEPQPSAPEPVIRVTIGRLEVQAILPSQQPVDNRRSDRRTPGFSLDDYLKQRRGGER